MAKQEQGLLSLYREYAADGEVPERYHTWSLIAVAGHLMGRRCFVHGGNIVFFPAQMMVILVGPSGVHKSQAITDAVGFLKEVGRDAPEAVNILPDRASPSKLIHRLNPLAKGKLHDMSESDTEYPGVDAVGFIRASEMGAYFSQEGFLETMATHITNLNDAPVGLWDGERFSPATYEITFMQAPSQTLWNPCIGMLAGTTPEGLASDIPVVARKGGFLARVIPVYIRETDREPRSVLHMKPPAARLGLREQILKGLLRLTRITGEVRFTEEAKEAHGKWYISNHPKYTRRLGVLGLDTAGKVGGYLNRREGHLLRTASVVAALAGCVKERADGSLELWVKLIHWDAARRLLCQVEEGFEGCYRFFGSEERGGLDGRLLHLFRHRPEGKFPDEPDRWWYTRLTLLQRMHEAGRWRAKQVDEALAQQLKVGAIEVEGKWPETRYRYKLSKWDGVRESQGKPENVIPFPRRGKLSLTEECSDSYQDYDYQEDDDSWEVGY